MPFSKLNYVNVGEDATFRATGSVRSTPQDVDALIQHLDDSGAEHVVIHLHGGLISEGKGMAIAEKMAPVYEAAGAVPVSLVYETGFLETLQGNLETIHETKLMGKLLKLVRKFVASKLGLGGLEGAEDEAPDLGRAAKDLEGDSYFTALEAAAAHGPPKGGLEAAASDEDDQAMVEAWLEADATLPEILATEAPKEVVQTGKLVPEKGLEGIFTWAAVARRVIGIGWRVLQRLWQKRGHGAYCTIVEEILREVYLADFGQWTWGAMKTRAREMFASNEGLTGLDQHPGRYLADGLAKLQARRPTLRVDVVGHSLGTVAACELLDAAADELHVRRIAFLAPAVRTEQAHASLFTKPERFDSFRMFTMKDEVETRDQLVPVIYPRSLLYFISGVLEPTEVDETILGLAVQLTGEAPYDEPHLQDIVGYLRAEDARTVWSITDASATPGRRSASSSHGDFDDDEKTRESLTHYLAAADAAAP